MKWLIAVLLLLIAAPAAAQNCQEDLPCQQVPWDLPVLPQLASPTPLPTQYATLASSGSVPTPTPTPTSPVAGFGFADHMATLQAIAEATFEAPEGTNITDAEIADMSGLVFSFTNWIKDFRFGIFTPLFTIFSFFLVSAIVFAFINLYITIAPGLFGFIRKVVQLVLEFLPF